MTDWNQRVEDRRNANMRAALARGNIFWAAAIIAVAIIIHGVI